MIFGGRIVAELDRPTDADEPALLRAAYNLRADSALPEDTAAEVVAAPMHRPRRPPRARGRREPTADAAAAADAPNERDAR